MGKIAIAAFIALMLTGCAGLAFSGRGTPMAAVYTEASANEQVTEVPMGEKTGEGCASSILGIVTTGDAGVAQAARAAGITQIAAVDHHYTNILGVYAEYCVVVSGQ